MTPEADNRVDPRTARLVPFVDSPRGRLMAAMTDVVAEGGYREASVDRVLERAHVGWTRFAEEFADLEACFVATLDAGLGCAAARAEDAAAAADRGEGIEAVFDPMLRAVLESVAEQPRLAHLCLVDAPALGAKALERREVGLQRFVDLLTRHLGGSDAARGAPPGLAAEMVVGGVYELLQRKARAGELAAIPTLADELGRLWLPALRQA